MTPATLPVTLDLLRTIEKTRQSMLAEERKPLHKRDPRPAIRLYAMTEVLAIMLTAADISVDKDDEQDVVSELAGLVAEAARQDPAGTLRALVATNQEKSHQTH